MSANAEQMGSHGVSAGGPPEEVAAPGPGSRAPASRAGRVWVAVTAGVLVLVVLLVFIFQNLHDVRVHFFTANGQFPLALALLFAVVLGALVVLCIGTVRILQLRRAVHRRPDPAV